MDASKTLAGGGKLSSETSERLREDRIFAAVAALAALGDEGSDGVTQRSWPGGIPSPTREELEAARRRIAQRLQNTDDTDNAEALQTERVELMRKIGKRDFSELSAPDQTAVAALAAAS